MLRGASSQLESGDPHPRANHSSNASDLAHILIFGLAFGLIVYGCYEPAVRTVFVVSGVAVYLLGPCFIELPGVYWALIGVLDLLDVLCRSSSSPGLHILKGDDGMSSRFVAIPITGTSPAAAESDAVVSRGSDSSGEDDPARAIFATAPQPPANGALLPAFKLPVIYSPYYNITACGIEKLHPFDSQKYGRILQSLLHKRVLQPSQVVVPRMCSPEDLSAVHGMWYRCRLHSAVLVTTTLEVPVCCLPAYFIRKRVLEPMLYGSGGTILAGRLALERGWSINLSGGYHHASNSGGGGFCVYSDITLSITHLRRDFSERVKRVMIVDLDAHQGNGHERDFMHDTTNTFILDCYNPHIYPNDTTAKSAIRSTVHVTWRDTDDTYNTRVKAALKTSIDSFAPDVVYYNAGTDCMENDPLGGLSITPRGILQRDEIVFAACLAKKIPIVMVMSGGYQQTNAACIADSIENLFNKFQLRQPISGGTNSGGAVPGSSVAGSGGAKSATDSKSSAMTGDQKQ